MNQLCTKVIAVIISHQLRKLIIYFFNNIVDKCSIWTFLQMVLQEYRPNFLSCQFHDMSIEYSPFFSMIIITFFYFRLDHLKFLFKWLSTVVTTSWTFILDGSIVVVVWTSTVLFIIPSLVIVVLRIMIC